jgi:hypothetical protein
MIRLLSIPAFFTTVFGLLSGVLMAGSPLDGAAFDRYTQGKTLFFGFDGTSYGVERYLPNRRVIWSFLDGKCQEGVWYEDGEHICFLYENGPEPQCWIFSLGNDGLIAQFGNDALQTELYEAHDLGEEMICHGPDVGV